MQSGSYCTLPGSHQRLQHTIGNMLVNRIGSAIGCNYEWRRDA